MRDYKKIVEVMIDEGLSIREASKIFEIPKSTLHRNLSKFLPLISEETYVEYRYLMKFNKKHNKWRTIKNRNDK